MFEPQTAASADSPAPSFFNHQANTLFPKFLDGSFNGNTTYFGSHKPKFMDGWFSNNNTTFGGKK
jgi:hypothetical protein